MQAGVALVTVSCTESVALVYSAAFVGVNVVVSVCKPAFSTTPAAGL